MPSYQSFIATVSKTAALDDSEGSSVLSTGAWKELPQLKESIVKSKGKNRLHLKSPTIAFHSSTSTTSFLQTVKSERCISTKKTLQSLKSLPKEQY